MRILRAGETVCHMSYVKHVVEAAPNFTRQQEGWHLHLHCECERCILRRRHSKISDLSAFPAKSKFWLMHGAVNYITRFVFTGLHLNCYSIYPTRTTHIILVKLHCMEINYSRQFHSNIALSLQLLICIGGLHKQCMHI